MKHLRLLLIAFLVLLPALCQGAGYGYPIPTPYAATILGTPPPLKPELPKAIPSKEIVLELIPELKKSDAFYYDNGLRCTFAYQDHKAPLIFLIAGTGSNHKTAKLETMMKSFYQAGFHVITMASPTHPNFIINASHSHIPGDLTEDAADLYWAMENAWNKVKDDIEVSDFYLSGYSLGGTQAAFVAKLDEERKSFNFKKVLMINPAVNLYDSVSRIEGLLEKIPGGPKKVNAFFNRMMAKFVEFYDEGDYVEFNGEFLYAVYESGILTPEEGGGLIGIAFRIASGAMIFTSDVMSNGGYVVPKNRVLGPTDSLRDYMRVSNHLSFLDYFNEYFYPYFSKKRPGLTKEALIQSLGLKSIEGYLKGNPKFSAMTNENDFILSNADRDYLKQLFGQQTIIYPVGGHLGNLEYVENMKQMNEIMGIFNKEGGTK
ncbi:MAG TPA: alpha/beta hydrolase [Geobacteraceae bacterium]